MPFYRLCLMDRIALYKLFKGFMMDIYEKLLKSYGSSKDKAKSDVEILLAKPDLIKAIKKLHTVDKLGYRTITRLLNEEYSESFLPKTIRTTEKFFTARGISLPDGYIADGMNEKGVAVGMNAVPNAQSPYDPSKVTIGELHLILLVLDYARLIVKSPAWSPQ